MITPKKILPKPEWVRKRLASSPLIQKNTEDKVEKSQIATVCEAAGCPNREECFGCGTATFMIMGDICTRNCRFCKVNHGRPAPLNFDEPEKLAQTIKDMQLKYVVITSVDRDDLADGGAHHFAKCVEKIRKLNPGIKVEVLTPDFRGCMSEALAIFSKTSVDVFGHNIETVPRLYAEVCPSANYQLSLQLLREHKELMPTIFTKSSLMVGLGETDEELEQVMLDLRKQKVELFTIGQYLQPSREHLPVERYVTPEKFNDFAKIAKQMGFKEVASGSLVRSSYHAEKLIFLPQATEG
jgi:lipoic acid synthetase